MSSTVLAACHDFNWGDTRSRQHEHLVFSRKWSAEPPIDLQIIVVIASTEKSAGVNNRLRFGNTCMSLCGQNQLEQKWPSIDTRGVFAHVSPRDALTIW